MHGEGSIVIATTGGRICDAGAVTNAATLKAGRSLTTQMTTKTRRITAGGLHKDPSGMQALMVLGAGIRHRLYPLILAIEAKVPFDENGTTKEKKCILGTASNYARKMDLRFVETAQATGHVHVIVEAKDFEECDIPHAEPFTKENAQDKFPEIVPKLKGDDDSTEYLEFLVPTGALCTGGAAFPHGKVPDEIVSMLEAHSPDHAHWYNLLLSFDPEVHDYVKNNPDKMAEHAVRPRTGQTIATTAFADVHRPDDDQEDALQTEITLIEEACNRAAEWNEKTARKKELMDTPIPKVVGGRARSAKSGTNPAEDEDEEDDSTTFTSNSKDLTDREKGNIKVALLFSNESGGEVYAPVANENGEDLAAIKTLKARGQALIDSLADYEDGLASGSAMAAYINLPQVHVVPANMFLEGKFRRTPVTDLAGLASGGEWSFLLLYPSSDDVTEDVDGRTTADTKRQAEEYAGTESRHLSRPSTAFKTATRVGGLVRVISWVANCIVFIETVAYCSKDDLEEHADGRDAPYAHVYFTRVFETITLVKFRRMFAATLKTAPHLVHSLIQVIEAPTVPLLKEARATRNNRLAGRGRWSEVDNFVKTAKTNAEKKLDILIDFMNGGDHLKAGALWHGSIERKEELAKEEAARVAAIQQQVRAASKSRRTGGDEDGGRPAKQPKTESTKDTAGDIICSLPKEQKMPLPRMTSPTDKEPCAGFYRDGFLCRNKGCGKSHVRIDNLSAQGRKDWLECVAANQCLAFNPKRVKSIAKQMATMTAEGGKAALAAAAKAAENKK